MNHRYFFLLLVLLSVFGVCQDAVSTDGYPLHVGDISFDANKDNPDFHICNEDNLFQYYNFSKGPVYTIDKPLIIRDILERLGEFEAEQDGYITIRFLVNCQGETDRFRVQQMDMNYKKTSFSDQLSERLVKITKALDCWSIRHLSNSDIAADYYNYLTFKIENNRITEILP